MKSIVIKKNNFIFFFILLFIFYISLCVSNKPENLDKDYYVYFDAFNANESKEITYYIVTQICKYFELGFPSLLFFYCISSLSIKYKLFINLFYKKSFLTFTFIVVMYMLCFFPLWEVTQIRVSMAISIFTYAIFCVKSERNKYLLLVLALLFHNSMSVLLVFYFLINYFYQYKWLAIFFCLAFIYSCTIIINLTNYGVYSSSNWGEFYNIFSLKNFYIFLTNAILFYVLIKNKLNPVLLKNVYSLIALNFMLLLFCIYIGFYYPSISIRYSDLLLFNTILALACFTGIPFLRVYKVMSVFILIPFYLNLYFFGLDPMFNFYLFLGLFI